MRPGCDYIWCMDDGVNLLPLGDSKDLEYAMRLQHNYPGKYKLYRLVPVEPEVLGWEVIKDA